MTTIDIPARTHAEEQTAIIAAVQDYVQGWYQADAERMARCLHPQLVKRLAREEPEGRTALHEQSATALVDAVRKRAAGTPPALQQEEILVLGIYGGIASARAEMNDWVDYLHLARVDGAWKIVNVLWSLKPSEAQA